MDMSIRDVMTADPSTVDASAPVAEAAKVMEREDVGSVPVLEGGRLVGTLTDRDIALRVVAAGKDPQGCTAGDVATRDLVTIDPQQDLSEALRLMAQHKVRRLPVVEEDGKLVGVVAQADVAREGADARTGDVVQQISQ